MKILKILFVVLALLGIMSLAMKAQKTHAQTSIDVRGAVSCGSHALVGVWVQSSGGGSKFASWNASPGDSWDGVYWATLTTDYYNPFISLHVGCGGTPTNWGSDNFTPMQTNPDNAPLTANCHEGNMSPHSATRCSYGNTDAEQQAINFATPYIGTNKYPDQCLAFVFDMYRFQNINLRAWVNYPIDGNTFPADVWPKITNGLLGSGSTPPAGALVFYLPKPGYDRTWSHVTLSVGGGWMISTKDVVDENHVHYETIAMHNVPAARSQYVGWWLPA